MPQKEGENVQKTQEIHTHTQPINMKNGHPQQ